MKQTLKQIIKITSQTLNSKERAWTALSEIQCLALDAVRKDNGKIYHSPSMWILVGTVLGVLWSYGTMFLVNLTP